MACSRLMWATRAASYLRISVPFTLRVRGFSSDNLSLIASQEIKAHLGIALENQISFHQATSVLKDLKYADSHEWVKVDGISATIGITDHAQDHLGDVVYVELPEAGASISQGSSFGAVESVKATSDVYSPVSGKVIEVNEKLNSSPGLLGIEEWRSWDVRFIRRPNDWEMGVVDEFLCTLDSNLPPTENGDRMRWKLTKNGDFDIRSFYNMLQGPLPILFPWKGDNLEDRGFDFVDWYIMCRCNGKMMLFLVGGISLESTPLAFGIWSRCA
uniref:Glycine cleavage system H protein n=1 Tax=Quercus lobata TaxID=97700 RepID=A0A7N2LIS2_QUELO